MSEEALRQQIQNLKKHNARLKRIAHDARNKLSAALDKKPGGRNLSVPRAAAPSLALPHPASRCSAQSSALFSQPRAASRPAPTDKAN
ncbi:hypothetical protein CRX72_03980 [Pantoea sp. BRM17]|nr:hypothetical protein CRX72_03980 [Pantoea sp. BRM17]